MSYYQRFRDPDVPDIERALRAIQEAADLPPAPSDHPNGPCSYALHGCALCAQMERLYRVATAAARHP